MGILDTVASIANGEAFTGKYYTNQMRSEVTRLTPNAQGGTFFQPANRDMQLRKTYMAAVEADHQTIVGLIGKVNGGLTAVEYCNLLHFSTEGNERGHKETTNAIVSGMSEKQLSETAFLLQENGRDSILKGVSEVLVGKPRSTLLQDALMSGERKTERAKALTDARHEKIQSLVEKGKAELGFSVNSEDLPDGTLDVQVTALPAIKKADHNMSYTDL